MAHTAINVAQTPATPLLTMDDGYTHTNKKTRKDAQKEHKTRRIQTEKHDHTGSYT